MLLDFEIIGTKIGGIFIKFSELSFKLKREFYIGKSHTLNLKRIRGKCNEYG